MNITTSMVFPLVDVSENHVVLHFPDLDPILIEDQHLDTMFNYPDKLNEFCNEEQVEFWSEVIPHIVRVRNQKRDLYSSLGF